MKQLSTTPGKRNSNISTQVDSDFIGKIKVESFNFDSKLYTKLYLYLYTLVLKDYKNRKKKITFIFKCDTNKEIPVTMKIRSAIINLIFWKPYIDFNKLISISALYDTSTISKDTIYDRLDSIIVEFKDIAPIKDLRKCLRHIIESLCTISKNFCNKIANTIALRDIIDLANESPEFNAILHTHYPDDMPTTEIEKDINIKNQRMVQIINNSIYNNLRPFIKAGGNIDMGQMAQCLVCIGPRSDIYGNISPVIVNTNFIMGLRNVSDYYLESYSCRKALIANRYQMSDSGYTTRQLSLLAIDTSLDDNADDCGTDRTLHIFVPDKEVLNMLEYKYRLVDTNKSTGKGIYKQINPKTDGFLIGTYVDVRSHIFCEHEEGHYCKKCYGGLSYFNAGLHTNILAAVCISEPIGQTVLSTKHINKTHTRVIEWSDKIKKFFRCESDGLYINEELCTDQVSIGFYAEDVDEYLSIFDTTSQSDDDEDSKSTDEDNDDDSLMLDYVTRFVINIGGEQILFDNLESEVYINSEFLQKLLKTDKIDEDIMYVSLDGYVASNPIFDLNIENIEIGEYLKRFMTLLGIKSKTTYTTIEDLIQKLLSAIEELHININFALLESIVCNMVRDENIIIDSPNFKDKNAKYQIVPTCSAIFNSRAITTSQSFERLRLQYNTLNTYKKTAKGFLDPFFK